MSLLLLACASLDVVPPAPPRIGITGSTEAIERAVAAAGGLAVPLAPGAVGLEGLDGLVLGPGLDLDPALYGELPHASIRLVAPDRQDQDLALASEALATNRPVLGVCLGAQTLAVQLGGALVQDIPTEVDGALVHRGEHAIRVERDSPLSAWYGAAAQVASNHHQAVDVLPAGLRVAATSDDGVIEAFWAPDEAFAVGVQFHPEQSPEQHAALWSALVQAARNADSTDPDSRRPSLAPPPALATCSTVHGPFASDRRSYAALSKRAGSFFGDGRATYVAGHKHGGVDLATALAEEVFAICEGRVSDIHLAFPHETVMVEHHLPDGRVVYSSYKHVTDVTVQQGDRVTSSTRIGRVFDAGEQRRAPWRLNHLHLEMRSSIEDAGTASWTSMSLEDLRRYAFDPLPFFEGALDP